MSNQRKQVKKFPGVYFRESPTRKHHGKPDRCFDITYKDGNRKVWEKVGWLSEGYSAQVASNLRAERLRALRHGEELPTKKKHEPTFGDLWKHYDTWIESNRKYPQDDRKYYNKHIKPRFATSRLSQVTPVELEKFKDELFSKNLAPATVKHNLVIIRQVFNKAKQWDMWKGDNPIKKIKLPKLDNARYRFLTFSEARKLLNSLKVVNKDIHDMALLSLSTGMRASEIFNLRWRNVNYEANIITLFETKGGKTRNINMNDVASRMLQDRNGQDLNALVFPGKDGEPRHQMSSTYANVVKKLGFNEGVTDNRDKVTFHTLRHTFASWLAMNNTPILAIKELLGHETLAMTERYAHLIPDQKQAAVNGLGDSLTKAEASEEKE
ncbi:MAG: tyrosine-type recombinase/integrase [Desulfovibrio aminophilus]|uniref:tyrosine-type recombinase/integrase n=1 Tax=Desulfovibrio aminophilus TaxID=81425 RepID=UPI0039E78A1B